MHSGIFFVTSLDFKFLISYFRFSAFILTFQSVLFFLIIHCPYSIHLEFIKSSFSTIASISGLSWRPCDLTLFFSGSTGCLAAVVSPLPSDQHKGPGSSHPHWAWEAPHWAPHLPAERRVPLALSEGHFPLFFSWCCLLAANFKCLFSNVQKWFWGGFLEFVPWCLQYRKNSALCQVLFLFISSLPDSSYTCWTHCLVFAIFWWFSFGLSLVWHSL